MRSRRHRLFPDIRERLLTAKSRPSSKEFICSVRPSLNDRYRLRAAGQALEFRQAATDPKADIRARHLLPRHREGYLWTTPQVWR